jgi:hypothetical protein
MAEARQKEMKVNITVVATKTFMAGLEPSTDVAMLQNECEPNLKTNFEDSTGKAGRGRGAVWKRRGCARDPSLRLKDGYTQDDREEQNGFTSSVRGKCG